MTRSMAAGTAGLTRILIGGRVRQTSNELIRKIDRVNPHVSIAQRSEGNPMPIGRPSRFKVTAGNGWQRGEVTAVGIDDIKRRVRKWMIGKIEPRLAW